MRAKYKREFELNEKILSSTLWARLEPNGRLVVGAVAKRQPPVANQPVQSTTSSTEADGSTALGSGATDRNDATFVNADITSLPPELAAARCPNIMITCQGAVSTNDDGCCFSPHKQVSE